MTEGLLPRPRISVCMAAHNGQQYIGEQIASILSELGGHDELVVVDDCSTDETVSVVEAFADPRIRLIRADRNVGYVRTFERALRQATGEVVFLSDQDDLWLPGRVDLMLRSLGDHLMVVGNCEHFGGEPGFFERIRLRSSDSAHHLRNIAGIVVGYRLHWGCAMACRRELLRVALPFPRWMIESHDQYLALAANLVGSVRYMDEDTVRHRLHGGNLTPRRPRGMEKIAHARLQLLAELAILVRRIGRERLSPAVMASTGPAGAAKSTRGAVRSTGSGRKVALIVSCFNPPSDLTGRVHEWVERFGPVVAVDDGSTNTGEGMWQALDKAGAHVIHVGYNSGIAHCLNTGIRYAREKFSPDWVLTMDQDSTMEADYLDNAFEALDSTNIPDRVGMLCAATQNLVPLKIMSARLGTVEVLDPMQSGTLIRASLFDRIGYLREDFFIDSVDSEFNARARREGFVLLRAPKCDLAHSLGVARPMRILGWRAHIGPKKLSVHYHPPVRVYYITRNNICLAREYALRQPVWVVRRMLMEVESHIVRFVFGPHRVECFVALAHGVKDAILHRMGPIDPELARRLQVDHAS